MKIHFLGTCAGTEPMPDRKHASIAIESEGSIYWFDAGEGCSHTAHLMGIDLLYVAKIIISHTHLDHVGGLCNLLWNIRKLSVMRKKLPIHGKVDIYIPNMETWKGVEMILRNTEGNFKKDFSINTHEIKEGVLFEDENMKVTAFPNSHMLAYQTDAWLSFSYLIECEGKKIIYSGDVGTYEDLDVMLEHGCDGLIIETGHFGIDDVYRYVSDKKVSKIFFSHNGREIINHLEASTQKVKEYFGDRGIICEDGTTIEF